MDLEYNLGDKVILDGLKGYWKIVEIESLSDSQKRYVLRIDANHKYKRIDCVEFLCCEITLKKLAAKLNHNPFS
jgi:hypothetical protein